MSATEGHRTGRGVNIRNVDTSPEVVTDTSEGKRIGVVKLPKSDKGRRDPPLDPILARRLWRLQRGPDELLLAAPQGGRMEYGNTYRRVLTPTLEGASAGLRKRHGPELDLDVIRAAWHTFRHTVASRLFADGRNVKQVQEWLGHHKASFTLDTYVHLMGGGIGGPLTLPLPPDASQPRRRRRKARRGDTSGAPSQAGNDRKR